MKAAGNTLLTISLLAACLCLTTDSYSQGTSRRAPRGGDIQRARAMNANAPVLHKSLVLDPLPAGTYTVGTGGTFPTIDSAYSRLRGGGILGSVTLLLTDTLYVPPPQSNEFRLEGPIAGTGLASRVTIRPADNVAVTIKGNGTATLTFHNVSYLILDGISLQGSTRLKVHTQLNTAYGWNDGVDLWGDCDHNIIQNVSVGSDDTGRLDAGGIVLVQDDLGAPDSCLISGVSIVSAGVGIFVGGYNSPTHRPMGNIIRGCQIGSPTDSLISRGIQLQGADGTLVEGNYVENLRLVLKDPWNDPWVIGINAYFCKNTVIRNNVVHGLRGSNGAFLQAISGTGASGDVGEALWIYNNMVYDLENRSTTGTPWTEGIILWWNGNALVAHNTVHLSGTGRAPNVCDALTIEQGMTNCTIRNNVLVNSSTWLTRDTCTVMWIHPAATFTSDHNDLYTDTLLNATVRRNAVYHTLQQWQGSGSDAHSVSMMPPFREPYLHIDTTNAAARQLNGHGIPLAAIAYDFDGQQRNVTSPDIGADEFTIPPPSNWGAVWTKDSRNPALSGGADGSWNRHVFMPCVLYNADSARYEMWFGGSYGPGTSNWRPYRIGRAVSTDGISWTMDPSPVLTPDAGTWEAYTIEQPMVIREDGNYKMWYTGSPDWIVTKIGYATSPDGIHWTKYSGNPVMDVGKAAWEAGGPYSCSVLPSSGGYRMWYGAYEAVPSQVARIGYATSLDGITWQRDTVNNPVVGVGGAAQWDAGWAIAPHVLQVEDTHYMWYTGAATGSGTRSGGVAISNDMGKTWTKHAMNPVLQPSNGGWDGTYVELGTVLRRGDTLDIWYAGALAPSYHWMIGHAASVPVTDAIIVSGRDMPQQFMLFQNYPNPFNPLTIIKFTIGGNRGQGLGVSGVSLVVYDILGREVAVLVNERKAAGSYEVSFDGRGLASGVYLYRLQAGNFVETKKMMLLK